MANCGRCSVERLIQKYGEENILEIISPSITFDCEVNIVLVEKDEISIPLTIFSMRHSEDEDCYLPVKDGKYVRTTKIGRRIGFAKYSVNLNTLIFKTLVFPGLKQKGIKEFINSLRK